MQRAGNQMSDVTALSQKHCIHLTLAGATRSHGACLCRDAAHWLLCSPLRTPDMTQACSVGEGRTACSIARRRGRMASKDGRTAGSVALQGSRTRSIGQIKREIALWGALACRRCLSPKPHTVSRWKIMMAKFPPAATVLLRNYLPSRRFADESP